MWSFDVSFDVLRCQGFGDHPILEELQLQDFFGLETVVSVNSFWKVSCFLFAKYEAPGIWRNDACWKLSSETALLIYMLFGEDRLSGLWLWASRVTCGRGEPAHFAQRLGMFEEPATSADF